MYCTEIPMQSYITNYMIIQLKQNLRFAFFKFFCPQKNIRNGRKRKRNNTRYTSHVATARREEEKKRKRKRREEEKKKKRKTHGCINRRTSDALKKCLRE